MPKYPIHKDFLIERIINPPMGRIFFRSGNLFLNSLPKWAGLRDGVTITPEVIPDSADSQGPRGWTIHPLAAGAAGAAERCILFIHGGGFVMKGGPYHYRLARDYATGTGCDVFYVDYRLAQDTPYGVPLSDCLNAYEMLCGRYSNVSVVGDSAGGFLALKVAMEARRRPDCLCLIYPVVDCSMRTASMAEFTDTPVWNSVCNRKMWLYYLQGHEEQSILDADLSGFPPTLVQTAEFDCLRDEGILLHERLAAQGVSTILDQTSGTVHGFDVIRRSRITRDAISRRIAFLSSYNLE